MPETERKKFGRIVRKLRERKGYTQDEFAHRIGSERAYFGRIERGELNFGFDKITKIIEGLEVTWGALFKHMDKR